MSLFKYIERVKAIHYHIETEGTGTSEEFADRLQISRSTLMDHLRELREVYNAPIAYCRRRRTFYYSEVFGLSITITTRLHTVKGGQFFSPNIFNPSESTGLYRNSFELQSYFL